MPNDGQTISVMECVTQRQGAPFKRRFATTRGHWITIRPYVCFMVSELENAVFQVTDENEYERVWQQIIECADQEWTTMEKELNELFGTPGGVDELAATIFKGLKTGFYGFDIRDYPTGQDWVGQTQDPLVLGQLLTHMAFMLVSGYVHVEGQ
ncbi:MAG: hypothetical protein CMP20_02650 [Rickettsiales bacterium]|nr:hypothetical protein [Rickettsiales bacterium]